jgi:hypothetical protein
LIVDVVIDPAPKSMTSTNITSSGGRKRDQLPGWLATELTVIERRLAELGLTLNEMAATLHATGSRDEKLDRAVDHHCSTLDRLQRLLDT